MLLTRATLCAATEGIRPAQRQRQLRCGNNCQRVAKAALPPPASASASASCPLPWLSPAPLACPSFNKEQAMESNQKAMSAKGATSLKWAAGEEEEGGAGGEERGKEACHN